MAEQNTSQITGEKVELGARSHLLMPVMEGNTLESEDVSSFLAGRLSAVDEESDPIPGSANRALRQLPGMN
ncbi:MAG: hypothetical protein ACLPWS_04715 [Rhodomicrobium sp.]